MPNEQTLWWYAGEPTKDIENALTNWVDDNVRAAVKECLSSATVYLRPDFLVSVSCDDSDYEVVGEKVFSWPKLVDNDLDSRPDPELRELQTLLEGLADKVRQELADRSSGIKRSYP